MSEQPHTPLTRLLDSLRPMGPGFGVEVSPDWQQGRAIFGGLSAALCHRAATRSAEGLGPLRSAQLTYIGPAQGPTLELRPRLLRQGKSTAFVQVGVFSQDDPVMQGTLCFGHARESKFNRHWLSAPKSVAFEDAPPFFDAGPAPNFAAHFNSRWAGGEIPASGANTGDISAWLQHKDPNARASVEGLVALADALPPAAMTLFESFAPASTMTWLFDVVGDPAATDDGWWLARSTSQAVGEGYSSQKMAVWDKTGAPVIVGQQNCAIFT